MLPQLPNQYQLGLQITEKEYRDIKKPSYSLFSDIAKAEALMPGSGYLVPTLPKNLNIQDELGIICGAVVDYDITENRDPDNLFILKKKPADKMKIMIKSLKTNRKLLPYPNALLAPQNYDMLNRTAEAFSYKKKYDDRIKGFQNYSEYIDVLFNNDNPFIISEYDYTSCKKLAAKLKSDYPMIVTPDLYNLEMYTQVKLEGIVNDLPIKGMLDFIFINHFKKKIVPFDLKTGYHTATKFRDGAYLDWRYYIQHALYFRLLKQEISKHPGLADYEIMDFQFMYGSRSVFDTTIYTVNLQDDENAMNGFTERGETFIGVNDLIEIYKQYLALDTNI